MHLNTLPIMTESTTELNPQSQHEIIAAKINELQEKLLANHPQMPLLLREIHAVLKNNPAVVTLLEEEQISIVVNGLQKQTTTSIVASMTTKSSSAKTKALSKVSTSDLGFD